MTPLDQEKGLVVWRKLWIVREYGIAFHQASQALHGRGTQSHRRRARQRRQDNYTLSVSYE